MAKREKRAAQQQSFNPSACLCNVVWNFAIVVYHIVILLLSAEKRAAVKFPWIASDRKKSEKLGTIAQRQHYRQKSLALIQFHNLQCFLTKRCLFVSPWYITRRKTAETARFAPIFHALDETFYVFWCAATRPSLLLFPGSHGEKFREGERAEKFISLW